MGNHFSASAVGLDIYMTNGGTDVFCDVIALAGSSMARTVWQQHVVLHFCDLERFRSGFSGFDLADLPWTRDCQAEHDFFLALLDRVNRRIGWEKLHYTPSIDYNLGAFARMLTAFRPSPTPGSDLGDWTVVPKPHFLDRCLRHGIFRGEFGCRLCDTWTQPVDAPFVWEVVSTYSVDGKHNSEIIDRQVRQIPEEPIPRIFALAGNPEPRAAGIWIEPQQLDAVSAIIETPLDPHARHWLGKAVA